MGLCPKYDALNADFERGENASQEQDDKILRLPCYGNKEASSNHRPGDEQEDKEVDVHLEADYLSKEDFVASKAEPLLCVQPQMVTSRFENPHPNSEDEEDSEKSKGNDDLSHYCRYFWPFPPVQN